MISLQNPTLFQNKADINGQWANAENGKTYPVKNPANNFLKSGTKAGVSCLYASKSARPSYFFSSIGTPDTRVSSQVSATGLARLMYQCPQGSSNSHSPHHRTISPK